MEKFFEIFQSIEAIGIIIFSLVATYYGFRVLHLHILRHKTLRNCCWITIIQSLTQLAFSIVFIYIFVKLVGGQNVTDLFGIGSMFIRPIILLNNAIIAIYLKIRFISEKNINKIEEVDNG